MEGWKNVLRVTANTYDPHVLQLEPYFSRQKGMKISLQRQFVYLRYAKFLFLENNLSVVTCCTFTTAKRKNNKRDNKFLLGVAGSFQNAVSVLMRELPCHLVAKRRHSLVSVEKYNKIEELDYFL